MLAFRPVLVDAILETEDMLPEDAGSNAHVEPGTAAPAPRPILGVEVDAASWVRVLGETYRWSSEATIGNATLAVGPAYLLGYVIEHPTPEASKLRADARAILQQAQRLVYRASRD